MTNQPGDADPDARRYAAATAHLDEVKKALESAGRGEMELAQLQSVLREYWRQDGPTIRRAGSATLDFLRLQLLAQLYQWRDQLAVQLGTHNRTGADAADHDPDHP